MLEYGSIETKPSVKENHTGTVLPSLMLNGSNDVRKDVEIQIYLRMLW